jgi:hypothetical protein
MPVIADMIEQHNKILAFVEQESAAFAERMKPYNEALEVLTQACLQFLNDSGQQNAKTEHGTAYKKSFMSAKVSDRTAFLDFIFAPLVEAYCPQDVSGEEIRSVLANRLAFLDARVLKDPVKDWREQHHGDPPGVTTETTVKCHIRRT